MFEIHWIELLIVVFLTAGIGFIYGGLYYDERYDKRIENDENEKNQAKSTTSFYSEAELRRLGFLQCGKDVRISRKASIYGANHISIGNHVRVDDFCILSGKVTLGDHIHIAASTALYGGDAGITLEDFANISSRVCIYALSDDFSGRTMTNPMIPDAYKAVREEPVLIKRHVIVGTGSTILPGVTLEEGTAVGAMSLVKESTQAWGVYAGIPARHLTDREKGLLELEKAFRMKEEKI